jgi:hypothetical protein
MSDELPTDVAKTQLPHRRTRHFRRYDPAFILTPQQSTRQSDVIRYACRHLADRQTAIAFLNSYNEQLGGQPLQLALDSGEGLMRVEELLLGANVRR